MGEIPDGLERRSRFANWNSVPFVSRRGMTPDAKTDRRAKALSKETIVEAAIVLLDAEGEAGLTFRALSARLSTGAGAIYWHVADKTELMTAASNAVMARALEGIEAETDPREGIRA